MFIERSVDAKRILAAGIIYPNIHPFLFVFGRNKPIVFADSFMRVINGENDIHLK